MKRTTCGLHYQHKQANTYSATGTGINVLSLPTVQRNKTEPGPTTTFKNWSIEVTNYLCLEEPRLQEILDNLKTQ
eukprot:3979910-Amphidinium_carterae.1